MQVSSEWSLTRPDVDWPVDKVQVFVGDSDAVPASANTAGSRSALEVGNAAPAAIVGAIEDALRTFGVSVALGTLPLTPSRVFATMAESR